MTAPLAPSAASADRATMAWLVERGPVSKEAQQATAGATDVDALLTLLVDSGHSADALRVVAAALPPREGIWWAWTLARHAAQRAGESGPAAAVPEALAATEPWIAAPDERTRRAAWAASERAGMDSPAGCAAAAPFLASGSLAPPEIAPVPPPPGMHTMLIATAALLAAAVDPPHFDALAGAYIAQGLEVVRQIGGWNRSVELAKHHFETQREQHAKATAPPVAAQPARPAASY